MSEKQPGIDVITSATDRLDHDVDLYAITSQQMSINDVGTSLTTDQKFFILKRLNYEGLVSLDDIPETATYMIEKTEGLQIDEAMVILRDALVDHDADVNIPSDDYDLWQNLVDLGESRQSVKNNLAEAFNEKDPAKSEVAEKNSNSDFSVEQEIGDYASDWHNIIDWDMQVRLEAALIAFFSPYPEVRAVTDPYDDPELPCETFRVYLLGIIWCGLGAIIDQFFSQRRPAIALSSSVVQIFVYPCGVFLHKIMPKKKLKLYKYTLDLNPGPWSFKEQMLTTLFYSVSGGGTSYASNNIHVQKLPQYYNNQWADFGYQLLLIFATNFMGFGLAGIIRKFAIYPVQSVWPTILPTLAVNRALMQPSKKEVINGWKISRYSFFFITFAASWVYFWFPDYIFQALSTFNWITWIKPNNLNLVNITGSVTGLGINPIPTFDWNTINFSAPLAVPFFNQVNTYLGMSLGFFIITGLYYSNYKWTKFIPINTNSLYTNTGEPYQVSQVINKDSLFDRAKYEKYGPPFYSAGNLLIYGAFFAIYPFGFLYETILYHKPIAKAFVHLYGMVRDFKQSTYHGFNDPYSRHMKKYKEVPEWVFCFVLLFSIMCAILCVKLYPAQTPVWTIFFAVGLNFVFLIPITAVYSRTGFSFALNVLTELIIGYAIPGNGLALNFVKAIGVNIDLQAENYITNQKQAHYLKIAPRALFRCQLLSVLIASFIQLGILNFQMNGGIANYCQPNNTQKFTCPGVTTFYNASIAWGVIGPKKMFDGLYPILKYCFLIGFLLVFPCIAFKWYAPRRLTKYFQPTVVIGGMLGWAPYNLSYNTAGLYVSFIFMHHIKKRYLTWWSKYNYILGAGLSAGVAFSSIIIYFAVQYHPKFIDWWGNNVSYGGYEGMYMANLNATESAPDGYFGPRIGHFP
jgi:OPT family small oligopeptide transporter